VREREPDPRDQSDLHCPPGYEPPRVERAMDAAELDREVLYAGAAATPGL
jgi:hypothetical protein